MFVKMKEELAMFISGTPLEVMRSHWRKKSLNFGDKWEYLIETGPSTKSFTLMLITNSTSNKPTSLGLKRKRRLNC